MHLCDFTLNLKTSMCALCFWCPFVVSAWTSGKTVSSARLARWLGIQSTADSSTLHLAVGVTMCVALCMKAYVCAYQFPAKSAAKVNLNKASGA